MSFDGRDPRDFDRPPKGFTVKKIKREELPLRYPRFSSDFTGGGSFGVFTVLAVNQEQDFDRDSFGNG